MTYATAKIKLGPTAIDASLTDDGWVCPVPVVESTLNLVAHPSQFSPADGDPMACAASKIRDAWGAEVTMIVESEGVPGRVY